MYYPGICLEGLWKTAKNFSQNSRFGQNFELGTSRIRRSADYYITMFGLVVLNGSKTWFLALREEYELRILENRVIKRIYGAKT
jgi:hypothetical protein